MEKLKKLIEYLEKAFQNPETSGFEMLEALDIRSRIAIQEPLLSQDEKHQLEAVDRYLLQATPQWLARISEIGDLVEMRQRARALPSHWWWYLDEFVSTDQSVSSTAT